MNMKRNEDLRVLRTQKNIKQTFIEMLSEMDYEKITVQELSKRAMINRKTFYLHYFSLDDLLHEVQSEMAQNFIKRTENLQRPRDMDKVTREFFLCSEKLGRLGEKLNCSDSYIGKQITDEIMKQTWNLPQKYRSPETQNIIKSFVSQATLIIYRQWIADEKKIPLEEIINLTAQLICNGINSL